MSQTYLQLYSGSNWRNMLMNIRYAEEKDFSWLKDNDDHISEEVFKTKIKSNEIYVAEENNKLIGWLRFSLFWDNIPFMNMIYFLDEHRGKGYGRKLAEYWEKEMKSKGFDNVLTSTLSNEDAQIFYRKLGYNEIGGFKLLDEPYEIIFHKAL